MYLKIFVITLGFYIILSFYITYPAIIFTSYVMILYIFDFYACVRPQWLKYKMARNPF